MSINGLFNSTTEPIPPLRRDLEIIPVQENGDSYLYFHDARGYTPPQLALHRQVGAILSLLDGRRSIDDLERDLGNGVSKKELLQFIRLLDENRLLASGYFKKHAAEVEERYEVAEVHHPTTAGSSYPSDPAELKRYLEEAFTGYSGNPVPENDALPRALYAPHIDPRIALGSYVKAFAPLRNLTPKRVVILATSHYAGLHPDTYDNRPFVLVNKDFDMPLGTIRRDRPAIARLLEHREKAGIISRDRAHRTEHSIELHLLFLNYLWNHDFRIVPFLIRDLDDLYYMKDGHLARQLDYFSNLLARQFTDDNTFFLISGDLAHFGQKFGDAAAASTMFEQVREFDRQFLNHASANRKTDLMSLMEQEKDPYRICGFPPLYTFLSGRPDLKGTVLDYELWDERERESAVTFGSILYRSK